MGFSYFLKTSEDVESFKVRFNVPCDINISYCHEGEIQDQKLPHIVFFPFMSILEGRVRFPIDPLLLRTLSFYGLNPDQCLPNFYKDVNYVGRLNRLYDLNLTHYDNNFLYAIQGSLKNGYYLQTRNTMIKFISCLPDSNRNSAGEFVRMSRNWLNGELTYPTFPRQIVSSFSNSLKYPYCAPFFVYIYIYIFFFFECLINSPFIPNRSFQEISTEYKRSMSSRAQFRPSLSNINAILSQPKPVLQNLEHDWHADIKFTSILTQTNLSLRCLSKIVSCIPFYFLA